jgi:1,4-dihydroxy-2-naphthoyl-CoA hydrolase
MSSYPLRPKESEALKNTLAEVLGMKIVEVEKGKVVATMPVDHRTHQPYGLLHGGASVALAETVASLGGWYLVSEQGKVVVGQEINANHLRSVRSGIVTAIGEVVHQGKTSQVWEIKIFDEEKRMVCISRCTLAVIEPRL